MVNMLVDFHQKLAAICFVFIIFEFHFHSIFEFKQQKTQIHSLRVSNEKRKIREMIAQKNMSDETLHDVICYCAKEGFVEELRLCVNVPRSSVECFSLIF